MDHLNIDVDLFTNDENDINTILDAIKELQKYSILNIVDGKTVEILPIIQCIVRQFCDEHSVLNDLVLSLEKSLGCYKTLKSVKNKAKLQIMKLFNDHIVNMDDLLRTHHEIIVHATKVGTPSEQYETLIKVYHAVIKVIDPAANEILDVHVRVLRMLQDLGKYQDMVNISDAVIKNHHEESFDCSEEGLYVWYFRATAFFHLNQLEISWKICKNTFHLFIEKCDLSLCALNSLRLLTEIAIEIKKTDSNSSKLDLCLDMTEHLFGTVIDWTNFQYIVDRHLKVLVTITKYFIAIKNPEFALNYLKNIKLKIDNRLNLTLEDYTEEDNADHIETTLQLLMSQCLYEMNDLITPYNILDTLLPHHLGSSQNYDMILLLTKITLKLEDGIKLVGMDHCIDYLGDALACHGSDFDSFAISYEITQLIGNELKNPIHFWQRKLKNDFLIVFKQMVRILKELNNENYYELSLYQITNSNGCL
jgi:hypothetical protein